MNGRSILGTLRLEQLRRYRFPTRVAAWIRVIDIDVL
jgi:hypothetical protein